ncbi:Coiled-coil domain-containing protein [Smittium culicis]|uniref:Coiled-coil domain-containing protein n=1 Tax=Smittium culicis TaxID=133412 RepID=A0A1R1X8L6_9FUNG|nr:Coiled-coil domain-containing protein [Smittium culicis]
MAKKFKGENSKVTAAKQKKAVAQGEKDSKKALQEEKKLQEQWSVGSNESKQLKKEQEFAKKQERLEKKKEKELLLKAEEELIIKQAKKPPAASTKLFSTVKKTQPLTPPPTIPSSTPPSASKTSSKATSLNASASTFVPKTSSSIDPLPIESFSASGINAAIDMFDSITLESSIASEHQNIKIDKSSNLAGLVDRHPERRHKAALKAYEERELPRLKLENKGLRLQQLKQLLWKEWLKSSENPFNQSIISHNASQDQIKAALEAKLDSSKSYFASN